MLYSKKKNVLSWNKYTLQLKTWIEKMLCGPLPLPFFLNEKYSNAPNLEKIFKEQRRSAYLFPASSKDAAIDSPCM